jgi:AcrR family transcriptional regulator
MIDKKAEILRCGKELFSSKGFKDTNVAEITKLAGIATGTFYLYYSSKEKLFMEIFLEENVKLKRAILEVVNPNGNPLNVIQELMQRNMEGITTNPILKEWYNKDVFAKIEEKYREENGLDHVDFMYHSYVEIVKKWQVDGKLREDIDSEMIMALFGAVIIIDAHKEEIGLRYFPKIQDYLIEFIMNGLTPPPNQAP